MLGKEIAGHCSVNAMRRRDENPDCVFVENKLITLFLDIKSQQNRIDLVTGPVTPPPTVAATDATC